jgi:hypothetical protein
MRAYAVKKLFEHAVSTKVLEVSRELEEIRIRRRPQPEQNTKTGMNVAWLACPDRIGRIDRMRFS